MWWVEVVGGNEEREGSIIEVRLHSAVEAYVGAVWFSVDSSVLSN